MFQKNHTSLLRSLYSDCTLCPHECHVNRLAQETGRCGVGTESRIFFGGLVYSEEIELNPTFEIYLAGCNLACSFCNVKDNLLSPQKWPRLIDWKVPNSIKEAKTISFLGGEPTVHLWDILDWVFRTFLESKSHPQPQLAWNSNFYFKESARGPILEIADIFIPDIHFGNDCCAERIAKAPDYTNAIKTNILWAIAERKTIVRHLLLPGHLECCFEPILRWIERECPHQKFHLLLNYQAPWQSSPVLELNRSLKRSEIRKAQEILQASSLTNYLITTEFR